MGIFSTRNAINESYYEEVDLLDESIDMAGVVSLEEGGMTKIIAETEINYTNMMRTIGICELAAIEESGDAIYEASDVSSFFGKIKAFFKNILEKIKRLFKNFLVKFDAFTKSGKDFVKKYEKQLITARLGDKFEFSGYEFTDAAIDKTPETTENDVRDAVKTAIGSYGGEAKTLVDKMSDTNPGEIASAVKGMCENAILAEGGNPNNKGKDKHAPQTNNTSAAGDALVSPDADVRGAATQQVKKVAADAIDEIDDKYDDIVEAMRGKMIDGINGSSNADKLESDEYIDELFKVFRGGEDTKKDLKNINVKSQMDYITGYDKAKKTTSDAFNKINKLLTNYMSRLDKAENELLKDKTSDASVISTAIRAIAVTNRLMKDYQNLWTQRENAHLRAMKDRAQQAKAICTKILTRKPTKESADLEGGFGVTHGSAFDNLKLI